LAAVLLLVSPLADGRRLPVRAFTVADGLPQNEINCILEDSRGFLWVGTSDGLARFDGRDFVTYGVAEGLPHPGVTDILEAPDGSLWLATGGGVARFAVTASPPTTAFRTYRLAAEEFRLVSALPLLQVPSFRPAPFSPVFLRDFVFGAEDTNFGVLQSLEGSFVSN